MSLSSSNFFPNTEVKLSWECSTTWKCRYRQTFVERKGVRRPHHIITLRACAINTCVSVRVRSRPTVIPKVNIPKKQRKKSLLFSEKSAKSAFKTDIGTTLWVTQITRSTRFLGDPNRSQIPGSHLNQKMNLNILVSLENFPHVATNSLINVREIGFLVASFWKISVLSRPDLYEGLHNHV